MSEKRKRSPEPSQVDTTFRSDPIEDRASKFIGYFSPSLKHKELQKLVEIASADHKILAWRRESNQQAITGGTRYTTDHDDDGEKYAGKRIAKVLDSMRVVGACVVARWYGGVLLGPVRFDHIEQCAKEAVQKWKEEQSKKRKLEEDAIAHKKLVTVLAERDESIVVLRSLAQDKEERLKKAMAKGGEDGEDNAEGTNGAVSSSQQSVVDTKAAAIDYSSMPLARLKGLERARDATLSFLLKRIDKAELELVGATGELPGT